ncbi:HelD family protein [Blastococcus sp. SYSU D00669]
MSRTRSDAVPPAGADRELTAEQDAVTARYQRLDEARELAVRRLREALATRPTTPQSVGEREAAANFQTARMAAIDAAESGLVFGRLDLREEATGARYVGRIGLPSDDGDEPLLVDWRAPAAQPFYVATALNDLGVARRRHIRTRGRRVVGVSDEVLDPDDPAAATSSGLTGESALLAALTAQRTGRMTDIVRTIQAEQDRIIRADAKGVLVVQGGPGTGKTAVALHRAAYLLYTHRERLARSGLLIVGPSTTFLRYIADVLPSLGETGVLLRDLASLRPGLTATGSEPPEVAEVKGRLAMADVVRAAVRDRQELPTGTETVVVDRTKVEFRPADAKAARTRGRAGRRLHNEGRSVFAREVVDILARRYAEQLGADPLGGGTLFSRHDLDDLRAEVAAEPSVRELIDRLWPRLTPERLLAELYASPRRIRAATRGWSDAERALLHRPAGAAWTPADVPLLEEADELLGVDPARQARADRQREVLVRQAQETLDILLGSQSTDVDVDEEAEFLSAGDVLDAELLAERQAVVDTRTAAERAADDRTWTFGHVVVDEAQELSAMAWRTVLRRVPTRSMTVVGDVAQTGSAAGATSWEDMLRPHLGDGWRIEQLTVNYRTPAEIMAVAAGVLTASGAGTEPPRSVRATGEHPTAERVEEAELPARAAAAAARLAAEGGTLAVLVPPSRLDAVAEAVAARLPGTSADAHADLTAGPVVLAPEAAKGLEFDAVLVVDPAGIVAAGVRGLSDLYVSLTRATRALAVVHPGELPPYLSALAHA